MLPKTFGKLILPKMDVETGKVLASFKYQRAIVSAEFSSDGRKILTAGNFDKTVKIWNIAPQICTPKEMEEIVKKTGFRLGSGGLIPIN